MRRIFCIMMVVYLLTICAAPAAATGSIHLKTQEKVALYFVGTPEGSGYRLTDSCGGGYLTFDDTLSADLAAWLSARLINTDPYRIGSSFNILEEGLYLVCSRDDEGFAPFFVTIPWDGYHWNLEMDPSGEAIPQTGDTVCGAFLAMAASCAGLMVLTRGRKNY